MSQAPPQGSQQPTRAEPAPNRILSRALVAVALGWLVVYNIMRIAGDNPAQAWRPSLLIGGGLGLLVAGGLFVLQRRLAASGRVLVPRPAVVGGTLDQQQRDAIQVAHPIMLGVAGIAAVTAAAVLITTAADEDRRSLGALVIVLWNLVFAGWLVDEASRLRNGRADGLDTVYFGCLLTAALAGVAFARGLLEPLQVVLVLAAGAGGVAIGVVVWRLGGSRHLPFGAILSVLFAAVTLLVAVLA